MQLPFLDIKTPTRDAWNRDKVVNDYSLVSGLFALDVPPTKWIFYEDGVIVSSSANIVSTDGMLDISSNSNQVRMASRKHLAYQPNRGLLYASSMLLPNYNANARRKFGVSNVESGLFFELENGVMYAVRRSLGVDYREEIKDIPPSANLEKGCLYDIQAQLRGVGNIQFMITHNKGTTVHYMNLLGTLDGMSISNPTMHITFEVEAGTEDATMYCGCVDYSSEGGKQPQQEYESISTQISTSAGAGVGQIIAIRQPLLINGITNTRDIELARIRITADKKASFKVFTFNDASAITATWTQVGRGSYVEYAENGAISAFDTTKMQTLTNVEISTADEQRDVTNPNPERIQFTLVHGDYIFIQLTAGASVITKATIEWGEEV